MDSPWDEDGDNNTFKDIEWSRISSEFTNVGLVSQKKKKKKRTLYDDSNFFSPQGRLS